MESYEPSFVNRRGEVIVGDCRRSYVLWHAVPSSSRSRFCFRALQTSDMLHACVTPISYVSRPSLWSSAYPRAIPMRPCSRRLGASCPTRVSRPRNVRDCKNCAGMVSSASSISRSREQVTHLPRYPPSLTGHSLGCGESSLRSHQKRPEAHPRPHSVWRVGIYLSPVRTQAGRDLPLPSRLHRQTLQHLLESVSAVR